MLLAIRERIMGVVGWILLGILSVAFAFFGLSSYFQSSTQIYAARVNDVEISPARQRSVYNDLRNRMQSMLGDAYDPALLDENTLKAKALEQLINQELLRQAADSAGFTASDQLVAAQINAIEGFQEDGAFSRARYESMLASQRMSPAEFEWSLKMNAIAEQMKSGITLTAAATPAFTNRVFQLQTQKRRFRYLVLRTQDHYGQVDASDADIQSYYESHIEQYVLPERVHIQYLELNAAELAVAGDTEEAGIQALYKEESARFTTPEQRHVRHILISLLPGADEATIEAARKQAESVLQRLDAGEQFDILAREVSDDSATAATGGDLGFIERGAMVPEFEDAVFSLNAGGRSGLVKSPFGFHIIELMEVKPEYTKPLSEVRDELTNQLLAQVRADLFYDKSEILSTTAFEQPDTLQGAATALGIEVQESGWIKRSGGEGIGTHTNLVNKAFSEDVLLNGYNSAPIEIGDDHIVVIRVAEHQEARQRPLDDVRDSVRQHVLDSKVKELVSGRGSELLDLLKSGTTLEAIAETEQLELQQTELLGRAAQQVDQELVQAAFKLRQPQSGQPVYGGQVMTTGDYALIAVDEVDTIDFKTLPDASRKQVRAQLDQAQGTGELMAVMESLRKAASISIPESSDQL